MHLATPVLLNIGTTSSRSMFDVNLVKPVFCHFILLIETTYQRLLRMRLGLGAICRNKKYTAKFRQNMSFPRETFKDFK